MSDEDDARPAPGPEAQGRSDRAGSRRKAGSGDVGLPAPGRTPADDAAPQAEPGETPAAAENGTGDATPGRPAPATSVPPGPRPERRRRRFVISQRLAPYRDPQLRSDMVDLFSLRLDRAVMPDVDRITDSAVAGSGPSLRRVVVVEADEKDLAAKRAAMTADTLIEPEILRYSATTSLATWLADSAPSSTDLGTGSGFVLRLRGPAGEPVGEAAVVVTFCDRRDATLIRNGQSKSDGEGRASIAFDPDRWVPVLGSIEPRDTYWQITVRSPLSGQTVVVPRLTFTGPLGWWHGLAGSSAYDPKAGRGIKVGVVDTGVGPHPYLDHVTPIGAFIDGSFIPGAEACRDVRNHGTHVTGLIGARPAADSGAYCGLAPGADIVVARIFGSGGPATQADTVNAITALTSTHAVDLINLSLGGAYSELEHDAVKLASELGALCIAAAGNGGGAGVDYPAANPECVAVSALGLLASCPPEATAATYVPNQSACFGYGGLYFPVYSNGGSSLACTAAGSAIISTVPASASDAAPYADMSGTSLSTPLTTGALASFLAQDTTYLGLPRGADRANYARAVLAIRAMPVGLAAVLEGRGVARS